MKKISANFEIIDNSGFPYASSIEVNNPVTSNTMQELKNKICTVYRIGVEQIKSLGDIVCS